MTRHYDTEEEVIEAFKANGFRYIVLDLYTYTLDQTPEKSLVDKYRRFMRFLFNHPNHFELIATDRLVRYSKGQGPVAGVFPGPDGQIVRHGAMAVYRIK